MFAVSVCDFDGQVFWGIGDTLNETWDSLLVENDLVEDDIDFQTVDWFAKVDEIVRETVTRWVSNDFE